jgi:hypothetical protein
MYVNNGIAWEERALDFFICGPNKRHKNVNYELKPALLGQNDLLKIARKLSSFSKENFVLLPDLSLPPANTQVRSNLGV